MFWVQSLGGVFVIGYCDQPVQREYLSYYKMGHGFFYVFYRPYHLCHLETMHALGTVAIGRRPVFSPLEQPVAEVIAIAKTDLAAGTLLERAIVGNHLYGEIEQRTVVRGLGAMPICLLELEEPNQARLTRNVSIGTPILWEDIELPDSSLVSAYHRQEEALPLPVPQGH